MIPVFPQSWINLEITGEGSYLYTDKSAGFLSVCQISFKNMKDDQQLVCPELTGKQMG